MSWYKIKIEREKDTFKRDEKTIKTKPKPQRDTVQIYSRRVGVTWL